MISLLKELLPIDAMIPAIGGALVWYGANYAYLGPELIGPRLKEKYYQPACERIVFAGQQNYAAKERALIEEFDSKLEEASENAHRQVQRGMEGFFSLYGAEGQRFYQKWGNQLGGGMSSLAGGRIQMELDSQRSKFMGTLRAKRDEAKSSVIHQIPSRYCNCVLGEALNERIDLAAYTASLRYYKPPTIRNIESGAIYSGPSNCGTMPVFEG